MSREQIGQVKKQQNSVLQRITVGPAQRLHKEAMWRGLSFAELLPCNNINIKEIDINMKFYRVLKKDLRRDH